MGKRISSLGILKIGVIVFVSYSLFANAIPYYEGADAYVYGISAIQLAEGNLALISSWLTGEAPSDSNSLACAIKDSSQAYLEALRIKTPKITVPE